MTEQVTEVAACQHACQSACGRPYDIITVQVIDGSTGFYCIPCFMAFAHQVMTAMVEPDNPAVQEVLAGTDLSDIALVMPGAYGAAPVYEMPPPADDEFAFDGVSDE